MRGQRVSASMLVSMGSRLLRPMTSLFLSISTIHSTQSSELRRGLWIPNAPQDHRVSAHRVPTSCLQGASHWSRGSQCFCVAQSSPSLPFSLCHFTWAPVFHNLSPREISAAPALSIFPRGDA